MTPADVAKALGVAEGDVLTVIESGELTAKKIGSSYRIKRSALEEYLESLVDDLARALGDDD